MQPDKSQYYPLSFSSLKAFSVSPLSFLHYKLKKSAPTPSMLFGTLVHRYVLEPDAYLESVVIYEGRRDKRTQVYREFLEENEGKDVLTQAEADRVRYAGSRCLQHPLADEVLNNCIHFEMPVEFSREDIPHRGIVDACGPVVMCDLKTTQSVDPNRMQRTVYDQRYHMQAAMYMAAVGALTGSMPDEYYIIGIENIEPFNCHVFRLDDRLIQRGAAEWDALLEEWNEWDGSVQHPGYRNGAPTLITEPAWAPEIPTLWT